MSDTPNVLLKVSPSKSNKKKGEMLDALVILHSINDGGLSFKFHNDLISLFFHF